MKVMLKQNYLQQKHLRVVKALSYTVRVLSLLLIILSVAFSRMSLFWEPQHYNRDVVIFLC